MNSLFAGFETVEGGDGGGMAKIHDRFNTMPRGRALWRSLIFPRHSLFLFFSLLPAFVDFFFPVFFVLKQAYKRNAHYGEEEEATIGARIHAHIQTHSLLYTAQREGGKGNKTKRNVC